MNLDKLFLILSDNSDNITLLTSLLVVACVLLGVSSTVLINIYFLVQISHTTVKVLSGEQQSTEQHVFLLKQWVVFASVMVLEYLLSILSGNIPSTLIYNMIKTGVLFTFLREDNRVIEFYDQVLTPSYLNYQVTLQKIAGIVFSQAEQYRNTKSDDQNYDMLSKIKSYMPHLFNTGKQKKMA